jgi:hypothetical protein
MMNLIESRAAQVKGEITGETRSRVESLSTIEKSL